MPKLCEEGNLSEKGYVRGNCLENENHKHNNKHWIKEVQNDKVYC